MPGIFTVIGQSWNFYRNNPVVKEVSLWFFFVPMLVIGVSQTLLPVGEETASDTWVTATPSLRLLFFIVNLGAVIFFVWGILCTYLVGRKMLTKAGRGRTSFKAVYKEGRGLLPPFLLTSLLRGCIALLWSLLFVIPGIVYLLRTFFYGIAMVHEGAQYREALRLSRAAIIGRTWSIFWLSLGLVVFLFFPQALFTGVLRDIAEAVDPRFLFLVDLLDAATASLVLTLYFLSQVILYKHFTKSR